MRVSYTALSIHTHDRSKGTSVYLVHGAEHLGCVRDSFHRPTEDVQRQFQPLQDRTALTVQTQALQGLETHTQIMVTFGNIT